MKNSQSGSSGIVSVALAAGCLFLQGSSCFAQEPRDTEGFNTHAELVSEMSAIQPGASFWVAIHLTMAEHWHTYWVNPGDSGLSTRVKWKLPAGWHASDLLWPVPKRIAEGDLITYAYEEDVMLFAELTPPSNLPISDSVLLEADVLWLECKDICIPGAAPLSLALPVSDTPQLNADTHRRFEAFRQQLPKEDPALRTTAVIGDDLILVDINVEGAAEYRVESFFSLNPPESRLTRFESNPSQIMLYLESNTNEATGEWLEGVLVLKHTPSGATRNLTIRAQMRSIATRPRMEPGETSPSGETPITLLIAFIFAFIGGILLNIMPCVFPVLAIKILGFVEQAREEPKRVKRHGLCFFAGVLVSFWILTAILIILRSSGQHLGWGFQLQSPEFLLFLIALFSLIGLNLLGIFEIGVGITIGSHTASMKGYGGSFIAGLLATVLATPCTAPFMGAALGFTLTRPISETVAVFTALGMGMSFPYVLLSFFPAGIRHLPKPGVWMARFKQLMSVPLLLTVAWLVWVLSHHMSAFGIGCVLSGLAALTTAAGCYGKRQQKPQSILLLVLILVFGTGALILFAKSLDHPVQQTQTADQWQVYSPEQVSAYLSEGRPVFVDFTAAWCLTCQVNKKVLHTPNVERAFEENGVVRFRADWTLRDPVITKALSGFGRQSVPVYALYDGSGEKPRLLPEILTEATMLVALERVKR